MSKKNWWSSLSVAISSVISSTGFSDSFNKRNAPVYSVFADNGSVVTSATVPHSPLKKRHHALSYHFTREAIASDAMDFQHIPGDINPADILSKHWGYSQVWPILQAVLFWQGDTADLLDGQHGQIYVRISHSWLGTEV